MSKKLEKAYLVTRKSDGTKKLIDASAPANAIAHCAKGDYQAQRVDGPVLETLMSTMEVESASGRTEEAPADPPAGEK